MNSFCQTGDSFYFTYILQLLNNLLSFYCIQMFKNVQIPNEDEKNTGFFKQARDLFE
jgi:hypothetical protein